MTYPSFYHDKENAYVTQPWIFPFTKEGYYKPSQIIKLQKKKHFILGVIVAYLDLIILKMNYTEQTLNGFAIGI